MKTTVSVHWNKGTLARAHNERDEELCSRENHIDLKNIHGASTHEVWKRISLKNAYETIFSEAIEEYNVGKKPCRRLTVEKYMEQVKNDTRGRRQRKNVNGKKVIDEDARQGKQLSYEFTVKIGNTTRARDEFGNTLYDDSNHQIRPEELPRELQKTILKRYTESFQKYNPNFLLINVDYHGDEGFYNLRNQWEYSEDHVHMEIIPIANGYQRGLSIQNSMGAALRQMGINSDDTNKGGVDLYNIWAEREKERLEAITQEEYKKYCEAHPEFYTDRGNLEIYHPVSDGKREGGREKELYVLEQQVEEKITILNGIKAQIDANTLKLEKEKEEFEKEKTDIAKARKQNLTDAQQNAKDAELLAKDRALYAEKLALVNAKTMNEATRTHLNLTDTLVHQVMKHADEIEKLNNDAESSHDQKKD